jgi:hypothetical protein
MKPLTFSDYKESIGVHIDPELLKEASEIYNIDIFDEVNRALLKGYQDYLNNKPKAKVLITLPDGNTQILTVDEHILYEMLQLLTKAKGTENSHIIQMLSEAIISEVWGQK